MVNNKMKNKILLVLAFIIVVFTVNGQDIVHLHVPTPCSLTTSVQHAEDEAFLFSISPNPSGGKFQLDVSGEENLGLMNLRVVTVQGVTVYQTQFYTHGNQLHTSVSLPDLSDGHYVVTLSNKKNTVSRKMILKKQ